MAPKPRREATSAKAASELTAAEAALLAGLLQAPSAFAPTVSIEKAQTRRGVVLQCHARDQVRSRRRLRSGRSGTRQVARQPASPRARTALYFKEEVRRQLVQLFGGERVAEGGPARLHDARSRRCNARQRKPWRRAFDCDGSRARFARASYRGAQPMPDRSDASPDGAHRARPANRRGSSARRRPRLRRRVRSIAPRRRAASPGRRSSRSSTRPSLEAGYRPDDVHRSIGRAACDCPKKTGRPMTSTSISVLVVAARRP